MKPALDRLVAVLMLMGISLFLALITTPLLAQPTPSYTFKPIDFPGATSTYALGINDYGAIVGFYLTPDDVLHGFLLTAETFSMIDFPGAPRSVANGINNSGQIVGTYYTAPHCGNCYGVTYPFLLTGGVYSTLPEVPGSMPGTTAAIGINRTGEIVGFFTHPCFCNQGGFSLNNSVFALINDPHFPTSVARGINDSGQIVGFSQAIWGASPFVGFLWNGGVFTTISDPNVAPGESTAPFGINNKGDIAGMYYNGQYHGYLLSGGSYITVDYPGANGTIAGGVNSVRQIVGQFLDSYGAWHGFLATPACEFGPQGQTLTFTRDSGKPVEQSVAWRSCGGPGTLVITTDHVASAWLSLNGVLLLTPDNFNSTVTPITLPINLLQGQNVLNLKLQGKPGSTLSLALSAGQ
jgi:uncharacterized membrane protein